METSPPAWGEIQPQLIAAAAPAAVAEPSVQDPDAYGSSRRDPVKPFGLDQVHIDAFWIPAMWITADEDESSSSTSGSERADLSTGGGFGLRLGAGTEQQSIGLLYVESFHDEETTDSDATTQALYLDFEYQGAIADVRGALFQVGAGLGGARLNFDRVFDDSVEGAAVLHGMLKFAVTENFGLGAGLAGFIFGHPGDTVAYGTWLMVGASLAF